MNKLEKQMFNWLCVWNPAWANKIRGLALFEADLSTKILFTDISSDKIAIILYLFHLSDFRKSCDIKPPIKEMKLSG